MKTITCTYLLFLIIGISACASVDNPDSFKPINIDSDWQFHLGEVENGESPDLNTQNWRVLDLPHDWSIEGEYSQEHGTDWQSGSLPAGIGWYRKEIDWNPEWEDKKIKIHFEGIYLNSDVWINGHHLGHRPNGYIGFEYDLSDYLRKGKNIIAVRVDHSKPLTGRWYTGSGIYRHVWLKVKNPVYIENYGVHFVTPEVSRENANFEVSVDIQNQAKENKTVNVNIALIDKQGNQIASTRKNVELPEGKITTVKLQDDVSNPELWGPETPYLYTLVSDIEHDHKIIDRNELKVGFRRLEFNTGFGFKLNGEVTKLKGVCDHHTAGSVGAAIPDDVLLYRLKLLKEMGCNAIRTAHNPFSPAFYNICDSIGLMVMDEFLDGWEQEKAAHDYGLYFEDWWEKDAASFIKRDRNHPSVIIWSIGNEVRKATMETQKKLIDHFHHLDPTRPVTQGGKSPSRGETGPNIMEQLDLAGYNGQGEEKGIFERHHKNYPDQVIVGTEIPHTYQTRGVYRTNTHWRVRDFPAMWEVRGNSAGKIGDLMSKTYPVNDLTEEEVFTDETTVRYYKDGKYYPIPNDKPWAPYLYYQSSYDNAIVRATARKTWQRVRDLSYVIGQFRWGSFDYLGETNNWPSRFGNFGVIDICGFPKDHFYLYQSLWTEEPMVHILPHWTHNVKEGTEIPVVVYTNCMEVELFLNGKSLGSQEYNDEQLVWYVPYEPGRLEARAKTDDQIVATKINETAGDPHAVKLASDREKITANNRDVVHVSIEIVDENGIFCPDADLPVEFEITGPAKIIGVDNGDPIDLSSYKSKKRRTFHGKAMLLVQAKNEPGEIVIKARVDNLKGDAIVLNSIENRDE